MEGFPLQTLLSIVILLNKLSITDLFLSFVQNHLNHFLRHKGTIYPEFLKK